MAPNTEPAQPAAEHAEPWRAGLIRDRVGRHGAKDQRAFLAEIDPAGLLREALAERDEHERRRDAQRSADERDQNDE